ncbi:helicase [Pelistega indica]|uniref:Helicase n=1 Tax=Pelistega indica TaxID=1414851 RepID=V8G9P7_9BURK|nr:MULTISPECIES: ATP-dependent DNA helicase [Pelistega]ETD72427.1 helicase [Pelistega indica]
MLSLNIKDFFEKKLAKIQPGYSIRQSQIELSLAIEKTIKEHGTLIAEAGTGTGKTWAYLVPAFASLRKVIVSTGTRALQDQLYRKDAPMIKKATGLPVQVALLKGRANYICHFNYHRLVDDEYSLLKNQQEVKQLNEIKLFFQRTQTGDKSDCDGVPDSASIWSRVTSTKESCLNKDCPYIDECFIAKARAKAKEADIIIVNHALFFADIALRQEADIDLLPLADTIIFDEAHQLPDVATQFLGSTISLADIDKATKDIETVTASYVKSVTDWDKLCKAVKYNLLELRLLAKPIDDLPNKKVVYESIPDKDNFLTGLDTLLDSLNNILSALAKVVEHHIDIQEVYNRLSAYCSVLQQWANPEKFSSDDKNVYVRWVEFGPHQLRFSRAPLSVKGFANFKRPDQSWIFTSATLSVAKKFTHFQAQLGLYDAECYSWESPFHYASNGIMYVPTSLPEVRHSTYEQSFVNLLIPFIQKTPGGVLILCTTLKAVDSLGDLLQQAFEKAKINRTIFRQGESAHRILVDKFRATSKGVLIGSASFWEGVDFPGDLLTLLAIDKLPFAPPDDPVLAARIDDCRKKGGNPFMDIQIPLATIALKQGVGRLIRTEYDSGVLIIGDERLINQRYSRLLWGSLPDFYRTSRAEIALEFWD